MKRFDKLLPIILKNEGGYVNDPHDRGKETFMGIASRSHPHWEGWELVHRYLSAGKIRNAYTDPDLIAMVGKLYHDRYYVPVKADEITNELLALSLFDMAVNAGVGTAVRILQKTVGAKRDGIIGPDTITLANRTPNVGNLYNANRIAYYQTLSDYLRYGRGWEARVNKLERSLTCP